MSRRNQSWFDHLDDLMSGVVEQAFQGAFGQAPQPNQPNQAQPHPRSQGRGPSPAVGFAVTEANPRRFKRPRLFREICSWLSAQGLPNRYYQDQGADSIDNIEAVTLHVRAPDGRLLNYPIQLIPEWRNPAAGPGSSQESP